MTQAVNTIHVFIGKDLQAQAELTALFEPTGRPIRFVDEDDVATELPKVKVLLCGYSPRVDWSLAKQLRLLHFMGAGVDHLWPAEGLPLEVVIANARGIHALEMRDHTLALILAFERDLPLAIRQQSVRSWSPFVVGSVAGKTLGLLGLGEVGLPIAKAARALGMRVIGMRNHRVPTPDVDELVLPDELSRVLRASDYLVVTTPLTSRTRAMIGAAELSMLPPDAVVIVVSRGGIVDEAALIQALTSGRLRGAALDVFAREPLPESSPLWTAPNLLVTPHISGLVPGYLERAVQLFLTNLSRFEQGQQVSTPVDRQQEY